MPTVSLLNCNANRLNLWHFRLSLLLLILVTPSVITFVEANEPFYKGKLINIGSHRLHINCIGEGTPTIILDSGIGGFSLEWASVQKNLADKNFKVCSYDRAGYGWSDTGPKPRTTARITKELKILLTQANIPGPYLLVGHSFGGFNMRYFASEYPKLTAGLVLIDSSHPMQFKTEEFKKNKIKKINTKKNLRRRINIIKPIISINYPKENKRVAYILMTTKKSIRTLLNELENMETSAIQLAERSHHESYNFPTIIITRGKRVWPNNAFGNRREQQWTKLQYDLENISNNSTHYFAYKSGHHIHLDQPKLTTEKIFLAIKKYRNLIIKNELNRIFSNNLITYSIISSFNTLDSENKNTHLAKNKKLIMDELYNYTLVQQLNFQKLSGSYPIRNF